MQEAHTALVGATLGHACCQSGWPVGDIAALVVDISFDAVASDWVQCKGTRVRIGLRFVGKLSAV